MRNQNSRQFDERLGRRIRGIRSSKGLKIIDVANATGLTSSMISQVERATISPSIDTLKKIGDALSTPVSTFFEEGDIKELKPEQYKTVTVSSGGSNIFDEQTTGFVKIDDNSYALIEECPVVHEHERKMLSPGKGVTFQLLNPNLKGPIEFIYNIYEPESGTGEGLYSHPSFECGLILEGELEVQINEKIYVLKKGDSITFDSSIPHAKRNVSKKRCICVWANTPPWF